MRVIILCWEFPPRTVGKLAEYIRKFTQNLVENEVKTYLVTYHEYLTGLREEQEGVKTFRVKSPIRTHTGILTWVLTLNQEVERVVADIFYETDREVDLVDVHDWHFIPAAVTLKKAFSLPFLYSIESLEDHRSYGANLIYNMSIKSIEWLGMYEAEKIVVKSEWMRDEISRIYKVPTYRISVITPESDRWFNRILETYKKVVEGKVSK
jgi:glycosyltransferase involved in cell wall biosynthesis